MIGLLSGGCRRPTLGISGGSSVGSSEATLIMLNEARAWQHRADLLLSEGDIVAASAAIKEVLAIPFPPEAAEAEDVRIDAYARLAKLDISLGNDEALDRALAELDAGRKLASRDSFFLAHLEVVTADVYEARANRLTDPEAKKMEKRRAVEALDRSIEIDRRLQRALLNLPVEVERSAGQKEAR
jgi:tetratricopeptide (TPR) repeat protein